MGIFISQEANRIPPCPRWLLLGVYVLYLGLPTTASVPLFADIDWLHEGERFGTVQIILQGGLPYRDAFFAHGIFPELIRPWIAFKFLGESIAADRLLGTLLEPLAYVAATFYIWKVFLSTGWRVAGLIGIAFYPLLLVPRHIVAFVVLGLLTTWVYERRSGQLFVGGVLTGLGFIASTVDHALFLLGATLLFPLVMTAESMAVNRGSYMSGGTGFAAIQMNFAKIARPLFGGIAIGLLPFVAYLAVTATAYDFVETFITRVQLDRLATNDMKYPVFQLMNMTWYITPAFYAGLAIGIGIRLLRSQDQRWTPVIPTLLFGLLSFSYARNPNYWKLAVVSFPFIVGFIYVLSIFLDRRSDMVSRQDEDKNLLGERIILGASACAGFGLFIHSMVRDWGVKEVAPRVLFPVLAAAILTTSLASVMRRFHTPAWRRGLAMACPMAVLITSTWFYNNAQPQVLSAQIMKPRLVKDVSRLVSAMNQMRGRLTREYPVYLQDEALSYLKATARRNERVVILAVGAGIYYFLADTTPPNRFPEVLYAQVDASVGEVIEGLERTRGELLIACRDNGWTITGWPMNARLSNFIAARYVDSGRRLNGKVLGENCPFSVWVSRENVAGH